MIPDGEQMTNLEKAIQVVLNLHCIQHREPGDIIGPYCAECTSPIDGGPEPYPCVTVKAVLDTFGEGVSIPVDSKVIPDEAAAPDSHWGCMTCSAGSNSPVTNRQAEIAAANHASQGGHPTVYAASASKETK